MRGRSWATSSSFEFWAREGLEGTVKAQVFRAADFDKLFRFSVQLWFKRQIPNFNLEIGQVDSKIERILKSGFTGLLISNNCFRLGFDFSSQNRSFTLESRQNHLALEYQIVCRNIDFLGLWFLNIRLDCWLASSFWVETNIFHF